MTLRLFWRQHFRYGRGARAVHRSRAERRGRAERERARFYVGLVLYPLGRVPRRRAPALVLLALLSQVATACGYAAELLSGRAAGGRGGTSLALRARSTPAPDR
jgi:hypothetical protein